MPANFEIKRSKTLRVLRLAARRSLGGRKRFLSHLRAKPDPFARLTRVSPVNANLNSNLPNNLRNQVQEPPIAKPLGAWDSEGFAPAGLEQTRKKPIRCLQLRPVFQQPLPTIQATIAPSNFPIHGKPREFQSHPRRFSPPKRAGTLFAWAPQIAERSFRCNLPRIGILGRLPSEATGRRFPLLCRV